MIKQGKNLQIRPMEQEDWKLISDWYYSGKYNEFFRDSDMVPKRDSFISYSNLFGAQTFIIYNIEKLAIGCIIIYDSKVLVGKASLSILIDEKHQSLKLCQEAITIITDYLFGHLRLRKLIVDCLESNVKLQSLVEYGGFIKEALLIGDSLMYGEPVNVIRFYMDRERAKEKIKEFRGLLL